MDNLVRWRQIRNGKPEIVPGGCTIHTHGCNLSALGNDVVRTIRINS